MSYVQRNKLSNNLQKNIQVLRKTYKDCSDVVFRKIRIGKSSIAYIVYIDGLTNVEELDDSVISPLMHASKWNSDTLLTDSISVSNAKTITTYDDCDSHILIGDPVILIENNEQAFAVFLRKTTDRAIEEPLAEEVVRGPREGFIENISVNVSLLRKRIKTSQLKTVEMEIGTQTKTKVVITYIQGVAKPSLVKEVKNRLDKINIDGVLDSHTMEELVEDNPYSPFPQLLPTERPDTVSGQLLEGRVAILVDGTPISLIAPAALASMMQSSEDYYVGYMIATATRWLRYIFLFLSLLLPSLYVAITTYHQEMIPTVLLLKIMSSREEVPFPVFTEVLIMEVTFEALREAGLRLPKQVGSAVSIVGALVIGESAVSAGIVSAPIVIVVALTGIASFTIPKYSIAEMTRILRFPFIIIASMIGVLGIMFMFILVIIHLSSLRSFGEPYLNPFAPFKKGDLKDTVIRAPWWKLDKRPEGSTPENIIRQSENQKPSPYN